MAQGLERPDHQAGADQQHQRQGHLRHDQNAAARCRSLLSLSERPPLRRPAASCGRAYLKTGISPKSSPRCQRNPQRKASTGRSIAMLSDARQMGQIRGRQHAQRGIGQGQARAAPPADGQQQRFRAAVRAPIRPQPAPSAARTASSCWRPSARTSSRFATLAHAISSTMPTVPISTHSVLPISPTRSSFSGRRLPESGRREHLHAEAGVHRESSRRHWQHARDIGIRLRQRYARLHAGQCPDS